MKSGVRAKFFRGLSDPSRLRVLEVLSDGERCVGDLVQATRLSQSNLSMHLACLRDCGLVRARRNGRFVYYELADPAVARLLETAEKVLENVSKLIEVCSRYEVDKNRDARRTKTRSQLPVRRD